MIRSDQGRSYQQILYIYDFCMFLHLISFFSLVSFFFFSSYDHFIPVVSHKAVAEVPKIGNYWRGEIVVMHGWQSESTDGPRWLELCFLKWLRWSPHPQLQDVMRCSGVQFSCSCSCSCSVVDVFEVVVL